MTSSQINDESQEVKRPLNFSIEHILNNAGKSKEDNGDNLAPGDLSMMSFPWLHCTRYCPPKITRRRDPPQKRQLGRHPRIPFTTHQLGVLEEHFGRSPYLSSQEVKDVSRKLDLADVRVKIWFQNRRARERRERSTKHLEQMEKYACALRTSQSSTANNTSPSTSISGHSHVPEKTDNFRLISTQSKRKPTTANFNLISSNLHL